MTPPGAESLASDGWTSHWVTAEDGLRLHLRVYGGNQPSSALPLVCLAGLARTSADFHPLARALANASPSRQILALDARGRGLSDRDPSAAGYTFQAELNDVLHVLTALGIARAVFIGTSRGGILSMLLAAARPNALAGVVLNDIGPVIEHAGLMRLKSYVGRLPTPLDFADGGKILRRLFEGQFPKLTDAQWLTAAEQMWELRDRRLVPTHDARIARTLDGVQPDRPLPPLWKEFDALARMPVMVIRGERSDILTAATVAQMRERRHGDLTSLEIPDQGHSPLLAEPETIAHIARFAASCDSRS